MTVDHLAHHAATIGDRLAVIDEWGEIVCAVVVAHGDLDAESVIAFARAQLSGPKVPKRVVFVDELPKTGSGKVLKRELRPLLGRGTQASVKSPKVGD